jgi:uncharacterized protein (TIGR00369 family)
MTVDSVFRDGRVCFVCGERNSQGLKLRLAMDRDQGMAEAEVIFPEHLQGWEGIVHGGLLAAVLDDGMIYSARAKGLTCVTGEMTVRYVRPASTGIAYRLKGRFVEDRGRIVLAESVLLDGQGREVARATGKLFKIAR